MAQARSCSLFCFFVFTLIATTIFHYTNTCLAMSPQTLATLKAQLPNGRRSDKVVSERVARIQRAQLEKKHSRGHSGKKTLREATDTQELKKLAPQKKPQSPGNALIEKLLKSKNYQTLQEMVRYNLELQKSLLNYLETADLDSRTKCDLKLLCEDAIEDLKDEEEFARLDEIDKRIAKRGRPERFMFTCNPKKKKASPRSNGSLSESGEEDSEGEKGNGMGCDDDDLYDEYEHHSVPQKSTLVCLAQKPYGEKALSSEDDLRWENWGKKLN